MPADIIAIGYGNTLRRDDAVGQVLASRFCEWLARENIASICILGTQLLPEQALEIAENKPRAVVFFDACKRGVESESREIRIEDLSETAVFDLANSFCGHLSSPKQILEYAEQFGHSPQVALIVTAPAFDMEIGEGLSEGLSDLIARSCIFERLIARLVTSGDKS